MSDSHKPVRDRDTILVRLPDGVKDRIVQRARASGRSAGAEATAMLEEVLNDTSVTRFKTLLEEFERINRQYKVLSGAMFELATQRLAIMRELKTIASGDMVGNVSDELKEKARVLVEMADQMLERNSSSGSAEHIPASLKGLQR